MRKTIAIVITAVFAIMLAACSGETGHSGMTDNGSTGQSIESLFQTVCTADEALALAKKTDAVVFEERGCTSGKEVWDAFYRAVSGNSPASVLCAHYYVLDRERVSEELYEEEKDQYPKLFFYLVEYDGKEFSVKTRDSTEEKPDQQETFRYLQHYTGDAPSTALYSSYDNYVLIDDPDATWDEIMAGMASSQLNAGYRHCTIYNDCLGWKEE